MNIPTDDKVTVLPVRKKEQGRAIEIVESFGGCKHAHVLVDPKLAELTCRDCKERLNPIQYIVSVAQGLNGWEYERRQIQRVRAELEARKKCRCTKCGEWTEIGTVTKRELAHIKKRASTEERELWKR